MTKNNQEKTANYRKQKMDFLDELQPDDFRNGGSFNQADMIMDELAKAALKHALKQENSEEFISKAVSHLFRENSPAVKKAIALLNAFIEIEL